VTFAVVLRGALLAGGSDLIHQVVVRFTGFMETTRNRTQEEAGKE